MIGFGDELSDLLSRMVVTSFIVGSLTNYKINAVFWSHDVKRDF